MLLNAATRCSMKCPIQLTNTKTSTTPLSSPTQRLILAVTTAAAASVVLVLSAGAIEVASPKQSDETLSNIPQTFSSVCAPEDKDCRKMYKIQRPKSRKAEKCTSKCVGTCIQGGFGSPGEGPFNIRRPLVVFKDGFRSRKYCLSECSDICNLIGDGDDGP